MVKARKIGHRIPAKACRQEVAKQFLRPAPEKILKQLLDGGEIMAQQAELAAQVPMADDPTAEADSGGHTDHRAPRRSAACTARLADQPGRAGLRAGASCGCCRRNRNAFFSSGSLQPWRRLHPHGIGESGS